MMTQSLATYPWVNERLDGEVPPENEDIIVVDSGADDSPSTKADRKRRREAIGRRYLLGHVPFILSASLQGPFGADSGWMNPRKRVHSRERGPHPAPRRKQEITVNHVEAENQIQEEICRYDADIEDEVVEPVYEEDYHSFRNANAVDMTCGRLASPPINIQPLYHDSDDEDMAISQPQLRPTTRCHLNEDLIRCAHLDLENGKKRNADTGWLKGRNIAKRSRHIVLGHSSPTPVGGFERTTDKWTRLQSSLMVDAIVEPQGHITSQEIQSLNVNRARADGKIRGDTVNTVSSADGSPTLENNFERQYAYDHTKQMLPSPEQGIELNDISLFHGIIEIEQNVERSSSGTDVEQAPEGKRLIHSTSTALGNDASTTLICDEILYDLSLDDMHGLEEASRLAVAGSRLNLATETAQLTKLDVLKLSSLEIGAEMDKSIKKARHLSGIRDGVIPGFEDITAFRNTTSPASTQSFLYRRTNRRSESCATSAIPGKDQSLEQGDDDEASTTPGSWTSVSHIQNNATISLSPEFENITKVDVEMDRKYEEKRRKRKTLGDPLNINRGVQMETAQSSSPDPLSEGFRDSSQARITPSNNRWIMVDELGRNSLRRLKGNLNDDQIKLALSDPSTDEIYANGQKPQEPGSAEFEDCLQLSASSSSPGPSLPKSHDGLDLPQPDPKPLRRPAKFGPLLDSTQASLYPSTHDGKVAPKLSPGFGRSDFQNRTSMALNPSSKYPPGANTTGQSLDFLSDNPILTHSKNLATLSASRQSPWAATEAVARDCTQSPISTSGQTICNIAKNQTWLYETELGIIGESQTTSSERPRQFTVDKADMDQEPDSPKISSSKGYLSKALGGAVLPSIPFPSTQVLVKATTDNPWNSVIKRSTSASIKKSVSFSSLPESALSSTILKGRTKFRSPPPPPGSGALTYLDDPFDDRLVTAKDVEIDVNSSTKSSNTRWGNLAATKSRAKLPPPSPAVDAMAEAFIAADKQTLCETGGDRDNATPPHPSSMDHHDVENSGYASVGGLQRLQARSSSPLDESFTIAPNGKLTAVNVDDSGYDAELNLADVLEDMGSFFEGWDIDTELKKARNNRAEKSRDMKGRRQRGYLAGVSNL